MKPTINYEILKHLDTQKSFVFAGLIARTIHDLTGAKESVVERRLRELYASGRLERTYERVGGVGPSCVLYRIKLHTNEKELRTFYRDIGRLKIEVVVENGVPIAKEILV